MWFVLSLNDEVHKVVWGESKDGSNEAPFRETFSRINELRSVCKPDLPILALTATLNRKRSFYLLNGTIMIGKLMIQSGWGPRDNSITSSQAPEKIIAMFIQILYTNI